nr:MAG TPA: hypothetical protein [Caudoviricetes sp.]
MWVVFAHKTTILLTITHGVLKFIQEEVFIIYFLTI